MLLAVTAIFLLALIAAVVYVFLMMPRVTDRADMDLVTTDYAHRGLHSAVYPENSLPAFALAAENGFGIELDVHLSRDGEVVVFHDSSAKRMCGVDRRIEDMTVAEIKALKLGSTVFGVPMLSEVLELVDGKVPLLIEIKGEGREEKLCETVARMLDTYSGAFAVQSFSPFVLAYFKRYRPRFARGQLVTRVKSTKENKRSGLLCFLLTHMLLNVISRPDFISMSGARINTLGFRLCVSLFRCKSFVWTVRTPKQYKRVHSLGSFAIFENFKPQ